MRLVSIAIIACCASAVTAQGNRLRFGVGLTPAQRTAVRYYLQREPGFNLRSIYIAKARLNEDDIDDFIVLSAGRAVCSRYGCEARVLLSHWDPLSGNPLGFQGALSRRIRTIDMGPRQDGVRTLRIDGRLFGWDGKTFSAR